MFAAMQETLDNAKEEFYKKFEVKERSAKKSFSFGQSKVTTSETAAEIINEENNTDSTVVS